MNYKSFEDLMSPERLSKYVVACSNNTRKAMVLYRYNLKLSQEMFGVISCFEVVLRNRINRALIAHFGNDWLRDFILPGGQFYYDPRVEGTKKIIKKSYDGLLAGGNYSHSKLLSEMEFGVWKFMFNNVQYRLTSRCLLGVFPNKPCSSAQIQFNNTFVFNALNEINTMRNRIAHHEPICFGAPLSIDTLSALNCYSIILKLFSWMGVDYLSLLYGIDHVTSTCDKTMQLKFFQKTT